MHTLAVRISAGLVLSIACAPFAAAQGLPSMDDLQGRKAEGQVVFGAIKEENEQRLMAVFEKRFPGIAVKYTRRSTEPMVQLVEAERRANRVSFDLLNLTEPGDVVRWIKQGFLAAVPIPDTDKMLPETFDPAGFYAALSVTPMLGIASTKALKPNEVPKSLKELVTDPKWNGKVVIPRPVRGRTSSRALMNVVNAVGRDFLKTAKDRDIRSRSATRRRSRPSSRRAGRSAGASAAIAPSRPRPRLAARADRVRRGSRSRSSSAWCPPGRHPNAARLLLRWLMSPEGGSCWSTTSTSIRRART